MQTQASARRVDYQTSYRHDRNLSTLTGLARQFGAMSRPSAQDIAIFREQFYTLILRTDGEERKEIANSLARSPYTPKAIALFFAMEEIEIATPVLQFSPVFAPTDLSAIVDKCTESHAKVVVRRNDLDAGVVETLLNNESRFPTIRNSIVKNASVNRDPDVVNLLRGGEKPAEPAPVVTRFEPMTMPDRSRVRQPENSGPTSEEPKDKKDLSKALLEIANRGGKIARKKPEENYETTVFNPVTHQQLENQLLATARDMNKEAFAISVQHFCGLDYQTTLRFLEKQDAGMLASLLCALKIPATSASRIMLLMNRDIGRNAQIFKLVLQKYENLDSENCVSYFRKLGATFEQQNPQDAKPGLATHHALSLAARQRREDLRRDEATVDHSALLHQRVS